MDEVFLNVTPLHRAETYIQKELNKLQTSVSLGVMWSLKKPISLVALVGFTEMVGYRLNHTFKATAISNLQQLILFQHGLAQRTRHVYKQSESVFFKIKDCQ